MHQQLVGLLAFCSWHLWHYIWYTDTSCHPQKTCHMCHSIFYHLLVSFWYLWICMNFLHLSHSITPFSSPSLPVMSAGWHRRPGRRMFLHGIFLGHRCYLEGNRKKPHSTWFCLTNGWGKNEIVCPKLCFWGNLVAFFLVEIQFHLGGAAHSMAVNYNSSIWTKQIWKNDLLNRLFRWPTWFDIIIIHLNWNIMMHLLHVVFTCTFIFIILELSRDETWTNHK